MIYIKDIYINSVSSGTTSRISASMYVNKNNFPRLIVQYLIHQEDNYFTLSKGFSSLINDISTLTIPVNTTTYSASVVVERIEETKSIEIVEYDSELNLIKSEFINKGTENYQIEDSKYIHVHTTTTSDLTATTVYTKENLEETDTYISWYEVLSNGLVKSDRIYLT